MMPLDEMLQKPSRIAFDYQSRSETDWPRVERQPRWCETYGSAEQRDDMPSALWIVSREVAE